MGRVVNFYSVAKPSKQHAAAQGCHKIQIADNTGVLTVRLWYASTIYRIRLGQLITLWTVHVSNSSEHNSLAPSNAPLFTSMFPEGERNCHFMIHENSDDGTQFKQPFNCKDTRVLEGLMTLKSFTDGGYDIDEPKLLVCVKSIGARKKCTSPALTNSPSMPNIRTVINRNGTTSELISLGIFDDTSDASLTLYSSLCDSASSFTPSHTILLISCPGWRIEKTAKLSISANSRIDIDSDLSDARRLRALAQRITKKEHVNPPFPVPLRDIEGIAKAPIRALYMLADIDDCARANPREGVVGYVSVVLTQLNIVTPFKRNMLMCGECCGIAVFANDVKGKCRGCEREISLRINPRIVRSLPPPRVLDDCGEILMLGWGMLARSHPRRNRPDRCGETHPVGSRVGAVARAHGGAACADGAGDTEVSGAEVGVFEGYDGVCGQVGGGGGTGWGVVCGELIENV
jgi:hypothetical protein